MNAELFNLTQLPFRENKPRIEGLSMVMDKGLSIQEAENFIENGAAYTDLLKLGFGTSFATARLLEKVQLYHSAKIPVYLGGTLFEAYVARNQFNDYLRLIEKLQLTHVEVSDGSLDMPHDIKCGYIQTLAKNYTVLSEVGSKDDEKIIPPYEWIEQMQSELKAGAWKVIAEARESGNVGIFRGSGEIRSGLVAEIIRKIPINQIVWEAPKKEQQVWFIKLYGCNVNIGNISPNELVSLETLRLGLRGDSFNFFLDKNL
ncbi:MAG: phosphosulfolactate synthase [Flavobacteriales bacterium]|nr:phosphosulfolactate synthase [Flavobacteriaceae bacterium]PHX92658.1 MAG: phosphosulfolactate synthase [Flavobacteriales bacterium]